MPVKIFANSTKAAADPHCDDAVVLVVFLAVAAVAVASLRFK